MAVFSVGNTIDLCASGRASPGVMTLSPPRRRSNAVRRIPFTETISSDETAGAGFSAPSPAARRFLPSVRATRSFRVLFLARRQYEIRIVDRHHHPGFIVHKLYANCRSAGWKEGAVAQVVELAPNCALACPQELAPDGSHLDLLVRDCCRPKIIGSDNRSDVALRKRDGRVGIRVSQRLQELNHGTRGLAARLGMGQQADAVWSTNALDMRLRCHEGFHDLQLAEHGRGKY